MLQYRTTYLNGTPIVSDLGKRASTLDKRLRQIDVAYLEDKDNSLKFLNGSGNDIWPSKQLLLDSNVTVIHFYTNIMQLLLPMMAL